MVDTQARGTALKADAGGGAEPARLRRSAGRGGLIPGCGWMTFLARGRSHATRVLSASGVTAVGRHIRMPAHASNDCQTLVPGVWVRRGIRFTILTRPPGAWSCMTERSCAPTNTLLP